MPVPPFPPAAMLARTAEKREERRKERLDDYYKRNFKVRSLELWCVA